MNLVDIPEGVISIGELAFSKCRSLKSIIIPNSVMSIGNKAFSGTGLFEKALKAGNKVLYLNDCLIFAERDLTGVCNVNVGTRLIANNAFENCTSLISVIIPNTLTTIGDYAFYGCTSLTSIIIPPSVISIGANAFRNCVNLKHIILRSENPLIVTEYTFSYIDDSITLYVPVRALEAYKKHFYWKKFKNIIGI